MVEKNPFRRRRGRRHSADPGRLAHRKVSKLGFIDMLQGVEVVVMIPGSPHGIQVYDSIRPKVNVFWQEFFALCGADLVVQDL